MILQQLKAISDPYNESGASSSSVDLMFQTTAMLVLETLEVTCSRRQTLRLDLRDSSPLLQSLRIDSGHKRFKRMCFTDKDWDSTSDQTDEITSGMSSHASGIL